MLPGERESLHDAAAGRCLLVGLPGPDLDASIALRLRQLGPAGVVLFRRNLVEPAQVLRLLERSRSVLAPFPILAIDQEGGRVSRLEAWVGATPTATALAAAGPAVSRSFGAATARALAALGLNVDFAPVVDLGEPSAGNGIGDRAFGTDPVAVCSLAGAFLDGLQAAGVAGCLKHFPGLGATTVDSHDELPTVTKARRDLEPDLLPYRDLGPRAAAVMVGHGHYPALDPVRGRPATCSPPVVDGLLRGELGFGGLVVSDDMEMGAVRSRDDGGRAAVEALAAGCDLLLYCSDLDRADGARAAIARAARADAGFRARLADATGRVARFAAAWRCGPGSAVAWDTAAGDLAEFARRA